ncbi:glycosyltransferase family 2 protein [Flavimobilis sp. GY10621]|uniref:4,4'-diaponeurosporenoate glycosyltransferase n=1 Tax=Flavimobilis rhizosphaerae TaxID=2775421 RepID=A0ABR9DSZ3_9MICO|nr:glycosyltransferase family 2 protein [Flavimobilis rhizosphaerae]MBD9700074.1 glycosyltransferase family 2 protein [Flavimobilis rhizosphaerae]
MTATARVRRAEVVVPAHDEEGLVGRCVEGLAAAVGHARAHGLDVWVTLVLDACRDATGTVAAEAAARAGLDLTVVELDACAVGRAREAGVAAVRARLAREAAVADEEVWLLHTDADSVVGHDWIVEHVRLADAGADVVVGTVRPDPADLGPERTRAWAATRVPGRPNGHVHGANLGLRLSAHVAAGGFDPVVAHEDVGLVARLRALPVRIVASDVVDVLTSGRTEGRAPHGYAQYLRERFASAGSGAPS